MEEENNVSGIFEEGVWKIDYVSNYSMNSGEAILEYGEKGGDLIWINKTLNSGAFCPDSVALVRND